MAEYITKDEALLQLTGINLPKDRDSYIALVTKRLQDISAADVAPVIHAKWIYDERLTKELGSSFVRKKIYACSKCGRTIGLITDIGSKLEDYPYCHCGAKMEI